MPTQMVFIVQGSCTQLSLLPNCYRVGGCAAGIVDTVTGQASLKLAM